MKTVIISGGEIKDYEFCSGIVRSADRVICADSGTRHAMNMNLTPDVIIGDMDSSPAWYIDFFRKKGVEVIQYPKEKDKTDTHICVEYALDFSTEIILLGATGSRIDHMIANISLLMLGIRRNIPISIIDNKNCIRMIGDSITLKGNKGEFFSLIPYTGKVEGLSTRGAHYELENAVMELENPYGVSNYFEEETVSITIKKGFLLVIKSED
ncbi:MAG TPA: thiamine diphosphokinase [Bacillota bacterium]|nr:thiamine diphosphokinase [Bacillota bacterium]HPW41505.1 thiamine diphosphokinase [Bacillota bacterium]